MHIFFKDESIIYFHKNDFFVANAFKKVKVKEEGKEEPKRISLPLDPTLDLAKTRYRS